MSSESDCPSCGSERSVIHEETEGQRVCTACGAVVDGCQAALVNQAILGDGNSSEFMSLPTKFYNHNSKRVKGNARGKQMGIRRVQDLAIVMSFSQAMTETAEFLFEQVYFQRENLRRWVCHKETLAAACIYVAARQEGWPVTLRQVASLAQRSISQLCHWKNSVINSLGLEIRHPDISEIVPSMFVKWPLEHGKETMDMTVEIVQLAKEVWLEQGKNPESLIIASAYISYRVLHPGCLSTKQLKSLKGFCRTVKMKYTPSVSKQLQELFCLINRLAKELPWIVTEISEKNVSQYLKDVIQFQKTLLFEAVERFNSQKSQQKSGEYDGVENDMEEFEELQVKIESCKSDKIDPKEADMASVHDDPSCSEKDPEPTLQGGQKCKEENVTQSLVKIEGSDCLQEVGEGDSKKAIVKRKLSEEELQNGQATETEDLTFLSAFLKSKYPKQTVKIEEETQHVKRKKSICKRELEAEELDENDMSDEELSLYIKTPQEMIFAQKHGFY